MCPLAAMTGETLGRTGGPGARARRFLAPLPPGQKKFGRSGVRPQTALHARIFPHRDFRGFRACPNRTRTTESEGVYGSAGMRSAGCPEVLPLIPRLVLQRVPAVGILRPSLLEYPGVLWVLRAPRHIPVSRTNQNYLEGGNHPWRADGSPRRFWRPTGESI